MARGTDDLLQRDERWLEVGRRLRQKSPRDFEQLLAVAKKLATGEVDAADVERFLRKTQERR